MTVKLNEVALWRKVGFWGLTINMIVGFPALSFIALFTNASNISIILDTYIYLLTGWLAAAGIRQFEKLSFLKQQKVNEDDKPK